MTYENGRVGICECGQMAIANCGRCGRMLCDSHARALPPAPAGVSVNALSSYQIAIRATDGPHCESCRANAGADALQQAISGPRTDLPQHWLDRAIVLASDESRSENEKLVDAALPGSLTATEVAREFLSRIRTQPCESVPITEPSWMRQPEYVQGWSVDCRRTQYIAGGSGVRYALPCLIATTGELLGPALVEGDRHGPTWWIVPEADIDLPRLVTGVAQLLRLSAAGG